MKVGVLFSGGKDSSLAALLLSPFATVELVSVSFGVVPNDAPSSARMLGFSHKAIELEEAHAMQAIDIMMIDGYPNNGINLIHEIAIERAATLYAAVADGTRRDDRVPLLSTGEARSLEDRFGINYVRPLLGYGRHMIDALVAAHFEVTYGEGVSFDYEGELRNIMTTVYGPEAVSNVFPTQHVQSKVTARKA
ncbi:MAG: DUF7411 family protein [Halobacteriota archaeon]